MGLGSFTHGSRRNEWRWCPRRCSVAPSDPASPASESGSSRVSPVGPIHGSLPGWRRSPAGTWTRSPALLLTPGGGRRAETRGTPRSVRTDHRAGDPGWEEERGAAAGWEIGRRVGGMEGWMEVPRRGWSHLRTSVLQRNPPPTPSLSCTNTFLAFYWLFAFFPFCLLFWSSDQRLLKSSRLVSDSLYFRHFLFLFHTWSCKKCVSWRTQWKHYSSQGEPDIKTSVSVELSYWIYWWMHFRHILYSTYEISKTTCVMFHRCSMWETHVGLMHPRFYISYADIMTDWQCEPEDMIIECETELHYWL